MKKFLLLLTCLLASHALFAQSDYQGNSTNAAAPQVTGAAAGTYLLLTEKDNGGSFKLLPGEIVCVRFEDTETCTTPNQPGGPFVKKISRYCFSNASSEEYLELKKDLRGSTPEENLVSPTSNISTQSSLRIKEVPQDKKTEHEWIFEAKAAGETTLNFKCLKNEVGCNGAPSPMYFLSMPITFKITTETE